MSDEQPHVSQNIQPGRDAYGAGRDINILQPVNPPSGSDWWLNDIREKVRDQWVNDILQRPRGHFLNLDAGLAEQPGAVHELPSRMQEWLAPEPLPEGTRLDQLFTGRARRRLLLLGKPGAGKSTRMLRLAETLLDRADSDQHSPVPVVLQLSAWDSSKDALEWVADQVSSRYQVPAEQVAPWLANGRLVLLLDGLDEIPDAARQRDCVVSLSALRSDVPVGMVVCCRTEDYKRIGERLKFGLAVTVLALTPERLARYLEADGHTLARLREAVSADPELAKLLDTPLMVGVAVATFSGRGPGQSIPARNQAERRDRLWTQYVAEMLNRHRDPHAESPSRRRLPSEPAVYQHLVWLARLMKHQSRTEIYPDWFGSQWLFPGWQRVSILAASQAFSLVIGLLLGLLYGFTIDSDKAIASRLLYGQVYGITGGFLGGACYGLTDGLTIARSLGDRWRRLWPTARYALSGLSCGLSYGLIWKSAATGLFGQPRLPLTEGLTPALVSALIDGTFCGLAVRLIGGVSTAGNSRVNWRWSWRDARYGMLGGLCCGICYGLVYGPGNGQLTGPAGALAAGLVTSLGFGVVCGWQPDPRAAPTKPGEALRQTLRIYGTRILGSLVGAVIIISIVLALIPATRDDLASAIPAIAATGMSALVLAVVFKGLTPIIDHHMARTVAAWKGFLPRDLVGFLDYCEERILLRRAGSHYFFLHRSLLDHLAARDPRNPPPFTHR